MSPPTCPYPSLSWNRESNMIGGGRGDFETLSSPVNWTGGSGGWSVRLIPLRLNHLPGRAGPLAQGVLDLVIIPCPMSLWSVPVPVFNPLALL